jgi:hypothetical protein
MLFHSETTPSTIISRLHTSPFCRYYAEITITPRTFEHGLRPCNEEGI